MNTFRITGPLWGEPLVTNGFPLQRASDEELSCVLWCQPAHTPKQIVDRQVNYDAAMTLSNGNIFRVTGPLWGWIPLTKASDEELWWSAPKQMVSKPSRRLWFETPNNDCHANIRTLSTFETCISLQWRHNGRDYVPNHQPHDCFPNRLLSCRSKKTSKLRVTGLCAGNSPWTFPFDDVIMYTGNMKIKWTVGKMLCCKNTDRARQMMTYKLN